MGQLLRFVSKASESGRKAGSPPDFLGRKGPRPAPSRSCLYAEPTSCKKAYQCEDSKVPTYPYYETALASDL